MSVHLSPCFRFFFITIIEFSSVNFYLFFNLIVFVICRDVEIGDVVTIGECRPLSKTVRFNVLKVTKGKGSKKSFKKF